MSKTTSHIIGRHSHCTYGKAPAIILDNPKYAHNVGYVIRAASCFGIRQVMYSGERVMMDLGQKKRIPREERLRGYNDVDLINTDYPFDLFADCTPVAVELIPNSESILQFEHPENAVYLFGPEDGSIGRGFRALAHRFIHIPSKHCLNLAAAVYVVLYDRMAKSGNALAFGKETREPDIHKLYDHIRR